MQRLLLLFAFVSLNSYSGNLDITNAYLDSLFQKEDVKWSNVKTEFYAYAKTNYKSKPDINSFLNKFNSQKQNKGSKKYKLKNPTNYKELSDLASKSAAIFQSLEDFLLELTLEKELSKDQNPITYLWIYCNYLKAYPLNPIKPNFMATRLIRLRTILSEAPIVFEKIAILILSKKIFMNNEYTREIALPHKSGNKRPYSIEDLSAEDLSTQPEIEPYFIGGEKNMMLYIQLNIVYPEEAIIYGEQGRIFVQFIIAKDGSVENVEIVKGVSDALDKEAIRVIENMPQWMPGFQQGEAVRVRYTLPIHFNLH